MRKSSSLPKLRKRSAGYQSTAAEVPESVREVRESVHLAAEERERESLDQRSGSETLSGERLGVEVREEKTPQVSAEELRLDEEVESIKNKPILTLQQPTPDVGEEVRGVQRLGSVEYVNYIGMVHRKRAHG